MKYTDLRNINDINILKRECTQLVADRTEYIRETLLRAILDSGDTLSKVESMSGLSLSYLFRMLEEQNDRAFSLPIEKLGGLLSHYNLSPHKLLFGESMVIELPILEDKLARTLDNFYSKKDRADLIANLKEDRAKLESRRAYRIGFDDAQGFMEFFYNRSAILVQCIGATYPEKNCRAFLPDATTRLANTYSLNERITLKNLVSHAVRYGTSVDYLLVEDYAKLNDLMLRDGTLVENEQIRTIIGILVSLEEEEYIKFTSEILLKAIQS